MHPLMLKAVIDACRARVAEGDFPTTKAIPVEQLEEAIVELAAPVPAREDDDFIFKLTQELVKVACSRICDDVDAMSEWDGDPNDKEKRFKAGMSTACEEIKCRIDALPIPFLPQLPPPPAADK